MTDIFSLKGKIAVVLGGAGGIGVGLAKGLGRAGATVIVSDLNQESLDKVAAAIAEESGVETCGLTADLTSEESVESLVNAVVEKFGTVDIMVNASGLNLKRPALEYPVEDWQKMFDINVRGVMIACKYFARVMKEKKKGKIINLSSVREIRGYTGGNSAYVATKAAVGMFSKTLALELAEFNINVNCIGPALIITPGTIHIKNDPELAKKYAALIPMGRLGEPEDLVGTCVFLASSASDFMSGQTLFVDGGLTAK
ncbi:MAG: glucose 1-dehydrogenase [Deltaproteobacteria bacterium]|nr:glucose 1-dehydrogenase [Deltaproteobacteria bacterium]MBW1914289.1 glucose 1-dehydrogenase [Deltaproteobacteria bacterium]